MKVQTITRNQEELVRETKHDLFKVHHNPDPALHPFSRPREYVRALTAAKLDRMFARPFVASLSGHRDGIYCMARAPDTNRYMASASADGEIRLWNLSTHKAEWTKNKAHDAFVRGISVLPDKEGILSCGDDKIIKLWKPWAEESHSNPAASFLGKGTFTGMDLHRNGRKFATSSSEGIAIWDLDRSEPSHTFSWGADTVNCVRFNQSETALLATCASDRSLMLHDLRTRENLRKVILKMRGNSICWNPQETVYLSVANEDYNVYTFDMRYFDHPVNVHRGHVGAVIDLDYSPTGQELVTAGYDRSIRIFSTREGQSRDIYHTRRMQRLFCVRYSHDSKYIVSGSDDGNLRIWKSNASESPGIKNYREQRALEASAAVLEKYQRLPEVHRILHHRNIPKEIKARQRDAHGHRVAEKRREENRRKHSKPGNAPPKSNIRSEAIIEVRK